MLPRKDTSVSGICCFLFPLRISIAKYAEKLTPNQTRTRRKVESNDKAANAIISYMKNGVLSIFQAYFV